MPTLYLDRDGIINYDFGHVGDPCRFLFIPQIFPILTIFTHLGYTIIVATNQSGIARGYYSMRAFFHLSLAMINSLSVHSNAEVEVRFCPHLPDHQCNCRKPAPGLVLSPRRDPYDIFIGDNPSDMFAALNADIPNRWLISKQPLGPYTSCFHNHSLLLEHLRSINTPSDVLG
jgi:D-glycero-D-manno-heptose 1,7-bisphosphate phosphatase